jgi:hypothetical protein
MSEVIVRRQKAFRQDRLRNYRVYVDGTEVTKVANGMEARIPVSAGEHWVILRIDWCRSNPVKIQLQAGEVAILECGPNATPLLALLFITILRDRYLWLRLSSNAVAATPKESISNN